MQDHLITRVHILAGVDVDNVHGPCPSSVVADNSVSKEQAVKLCLATVNRIAQKKVDSDKAAERELQERDRLRETIGAKDPKTILRAL